MYNNGSTCTDIHYQNKQTEVLVICEKVQEVSNMKELM